MTDAPALPYWDCYCDAEGTSRQRRRMLTGFQQESMGGDADVQWNALLGEYRSRILFAELPADFDGDWHENPAPQWIICLSGRWWVETMDFFRTEMGPGDVMFGRDQGSHKGRGHRSGVVGSEPARLMIVQLDHVPDRVADAD